MQYETQVAGAPPTAAEPKRCLVHASAAAYARFGRAAIDAELKLHGRAMAEQHLQPYAVKVEVNCDGRMICSWLFTMPHKSKRDARRGLRKISARMRKSSRQVIDAPHMAR